ncbi:MAG: ferrous iron transport protein B [Sedimentisphaerales bacterium]|nr:ferrous iron transport protein B [Sedimentisphaerales bacterium]
MADCDPEKSKVPIDKAAAFGIKTITVALMGNPNSGKTTIFNNLTGAHQHVGNYGGVTVETKEGTLRHGSWRIKVVDLPGTYSLTAYSMEEIVARNFIIQQKPDVIVDIADGANLERNLYLAVQLKELGVPMVLVLNMADEMKTKGLHADIKKLSKIIGAPVVPAIGVRNRGTDKIVARIIEVAQGDWSQSEKVPVHYGSEIENELTKIAEPIIRRADQLQQTGSDCNCPLCLVTNPQWVALKLLENDSEVIGKMHDSAIRREVDQQVEHSRKYLTSIYGEDPESVIAEQRYGYVHGICRTVIRRTTEARINFSDKFDKVLTNRLLGLPIFAALMYLTFWFVFAAGQYPMGWIETAQQVLAEQVSNLWPSGSDSVLRSLIVDGIITGVGGVIVFLPNIMLLFLALSLLEDTGYMARAAFIMDRLMKWVGLHGKSFIPMLTGFGCSVPAILATRILDNRRDRFTTILVLPLMSCGARVPIYLLIIPAFFTSARSASVVMYSMYLIGIVIAIVCARLLRSTMFRGESSPFVMELPPYRIPTLKAVLIHMWQRSWLYLRKAGTVILAFSVLMWFLASHPRLPQEQIEQLRQEKIVALEQQGNFPSSEAAAIELTNQELQDARLSYSITGRLGRTLEPLLKPLGFDWRIGTALVGSFPAKELFVSQMGIVFSLGQVETEESPDRALQSDQNQNQDQDQPGTSSAVSSTQADLSVSPQAALRTRLKQTYSPLVGFCIMLFCLISAPCMATVAVTKRETNSWRWPMFQFFGLTGLAYLITLVVYQMGSFIQTGI